MRFRVTSITDEGVGSKLTPALVTLEDWLNASLDDGTFGGRLSTLMIVVFSTEFPLPNGRSVPITRLASSRDPMTGEVHQTLAIHVLIEPGALLALRAKEVLPYVAKCITRQLPAKPLRSPAGLDFTRLCQALAASLSAYVYSEA